MKLTSNMHWVDIKKFSIRETWTNLVYKRLNKKIY